MTQTSAPTRPAGTLPEICNIPYSRNPLFVGRQALMEDLHKSFNSSNLTKRVQVVHGLAGMGKSLLAVEYAHRYAAEYDLIWWVYADDVANLALTYARLARELRTPVPRDGALEEVRRIVQSELDRRDRWLLIFDNAEEPEELRSYIPGSRNGHVLITSRNPVWSGIAVTQQLDPLHRGESVQFLQNRTGRKYDESAVRLAHALGDLPLALEQAAAHIEQTEISFAEYLRRFELHWGSMLGRGTPSRDYPTSIAMTWEISFKQVEQNNPAAADLLSLCAYFSPENIGREWLSSGASMLSEPLQGALRHPVLLDETIAALRRYSLVNATSEHISMHRLVSALARARLTPEEQWKWSEAAVRMAWELFSFDSVDLATWVETDQMFPHAMAAADRAEFHEVALDVTAHLLNDLGRYLHKRARYPDAKAALERALTIRKRIFGENSPRISSVANNLGRVLQAMKQPAEAIQYFQLAMEIDRNAYGPADPHQAAVVNNYGKSLHLCGVMETARQQFQSALAVFEMLDDKHARKKASVLNNLGYSLMSAGEFISARAQFDRALEIAVESCGENHPIVASILVNLGRVMKVTGDAQSARKQLERALAIDESVHGPNHPDVARDLNLLGSILSDMKDETGSAGYFERAQAILNDRTTGKSGEQ